MSLSRSRPWWWTRTLFVALGFLLAGTVFGVIVTADQAAHAHRSIFFFAWASAWGPNIAVSLMSAGITIGILTVGIEHRERYIRTERERLDREAMRRDMRKAFAITYWKFGRNLTELLGTPVRYATEEFPGESADYFDELAAAPWTTRFKPKGTRRDLTPGDERRVNRHLASICQRAAADFDHSLHFFYGALDPEERSRYHSLVEQLARYADQTTDPLPWNTPTEVSPIVARELRDLSVNLIRGRNGPAEVKMEPPYALHRIVEVWLEDIYGNILAKREFEVLHADGDISVNIASVRLTEEQAEIASDLVARDSPVSEIRDRLASLSTELNRRRKLRIRTLNKNRVFIDGRKIRWIDGADSLDGVELDIADQAPSRWRSIPLEIREVPE